VARITFHQIYLMKSCITQWLTSLQPILTWWNDKLMANSIRIPHCIMLRLSEGCRPNVDVFDGCLRRWSGYHWVAAVCCGCVSQNWPFGSFNVQTSHVRSNGDGRQ
jgi:hypothetical protein